MNRRRGTLLLSVPLAAAVALPTLAETRTALVVGNGGYVSGALANPPNDARDMAAALKEVGFDVQLVVDGDQREMTDAVRAFGRRLQRGGGVGLFYYAGHGVQVDGRNYLLPVDADIQAEYEVRFNALDLGRILGAMEAANNGLNIVLLDACRDNPFRSFRSASRGLAVIAPGDSPTGTVISYATAPGRVAADGSGSNSPYTKHLLDVMRRPGLGIESVLKQVRVGVKRETGGKQIPWTSSSLLGDFYFVPAATARRDAPAPPPAPPKAGFRLDDLTGQADEHERARAAWEGRQARMQAAYNETQSFAGRNVPDELKVKAWQRFADAYAEDDPYSQQDDQMRRDAQVQIARLSRKRAELVVRSNVSGDEVILDGRSLGPSGPHAHEVNPGERLLRVEKPGYELYEQTLTLESNQRRTVRVTLQRAAGGDDMVLVPAGEFWYGCNQNVDRECERDEKPGGPRRLPAFRIDRTEVTVAEYGACVDAKGCREPRRGGSCNWGKSGHERHPINCVGWDQASAFCAWKGKRLPTEEEWEKAARGRDGRKYPWGNDGYGSARVANIADGTGKRKILGWTVAEGYDDGFSWTAPVGSFPDGVSPYGALDMVGNVWEWTSDWHSSVRLGRVVRGGSWDFGPQLARASSRYQYAPGSRSGYIGFRCAQ